MPDRSERIDSVDWGHDGECTLPLLHDLVDAAWEALRQTPSGPPSQRGVEWGLPPDDCGDHVLLCWTQTGVHEAGRFPATFSGSARAVPCSELWFAPQFSMQVRRPCQPVGGKSQRRPFPNRGDVTSHAEALWHDLRAMTQVWAPAAEVLCDQFRPGGPGTAAAHAGIAWEPVQPHVVADVAGFDWRFRIELP